MFSFLHASLFIVTFFNFLLNEVFTCIHTTIWGWRYSYSCNDVGVWIHAVYDLTIGYKERCPLFINNLYGTDPSEVHMHIRRIAMAEIPQSEEGMNKWLFDLFLKKDQMLASFSETGSFPNSGIGEKPLSVAKGLFNFFFLQLIPSLWIWWWVYKSFWVKAYVCVVCLGLALSTYYSWRPTPFFFSRLVRSKRKKL